MKVLKEIKI